MFQVHRTDTGQFVVIDPATGVVVIDDELQVGYGRVEALAAERPARHTEAGQAPASGPDSAFEFRGQRSLMLVLAVVLPLVWFGFVYLALRDLDRPSTELESQLEALKLEVEGLRRELADNQGPSSPTDAPRD